MGSPVSAFDPQIAHTLTHKHAKAHICINASAHIHTDRHNTHTLNRKKASILSAGTEA